MIQGNHASHSLGVLGPSQQNGYHLSYWPSRCTSVAIAMVGTLDSILSPFYPGINVPISCFSFKCLSKIFYLLNCHNCRVFRKIFYPFLSSSLSWTFWVFSRSVSVQPQLAVVHHTSFHTPQESLIHIKTISWSLPCIIVKFHLFQIIIRIANGYSSKNFFVTRKTFCEYWFYIGYNTLPLTYTIHLPIRGEVKG